MALSGQPKNWRTATASLCIQKSLGLIGSDESSVERWIATEEGLDKVRAGEHFRRIALLLFVHSRDSRSKLVVFLWTSRSISSTKQLGNEICEHGIQAQHLVACPTLTQRQLADRLTFADEHLPRERDQ